MPFCMNCGTPYAEGKKFCRKCGASLEAPLAPIITQPILPTSDAPTPPPPVTTPRPGVPISAERKLGEGKSAVLSVVLNYLLPGVGYMYYGYHYVNVLDGKPPKHMKNVAGHMINLDALNSPEVIFFIFTILLGALVGILFGLYLGVALVLVYHTVFAYDLAMKTRGGQGLWWPAY